MTKPEIEKPILAVDIVLIQEQKVLLIQRKYPPFQGQWALPGGHVEKDEPLEKAALRELEEETSVTGIPIYQFGTYGDPGRDPRGWVVSVGYTTQIDKDTSVYIKAADDAKEAEWFPLDGLPQLAFDHAKILNDALAFKNQI